jgi:16S rRNA (adenine1518-N6/adenine1519-N6)-dimethyltransferase
MKNSGFLTPQQYFRLRGITPRKRFGQHFLAQPTTALRIVESANLLPSDTVVEVGPGLGALTRNIIPTVERLHLVELDRDLAEYLREQTALSDREIVVHQQDILKFDFASLSRSEGRRIVVLGNLPYNITSPLMFRMLESRSAIVRAVFMVQKEVGERLAASPGKKDYGVLSVLLGYYCNVVPLFTVGPNQFYPPPKVDSLVISIDFSRQMPESTPSFSLFRKLVNTAFQQRRKTLQNSLKSLSGQSAEHLENIFAKTGIDSRRRPETLSPDEFARLALALEE